MPAATPLRRHGGMSDAERQVREDLAAAYRLVALCGMDDSIYTHISARVPGTDDQFLINPYGWLFRDITASSLVKIDLEGRIVEPTDDDVNPAGFTIHSPVPAARHDATCVLHSHTVAGVPYHAYEAIGHARDERARLVADLGPTKRALILRNHGLVTLGRTVAEAFILMHNLDRACRVQLGIQATGPAVHPVPHEGAERTALQYESAASRAMAGAPDPNLREWKAPLRRLEPGPATSFRD